MPVPSCRCQPTSGARVELTAFRESDHPIFDALKRFKPQTVDAPVSDSTVRYQAARPKDGQVPGSCETIQIAQFRDLRDGQPLPARVHIYMEGLKDAGAIRVARGRHRAHRVYAAPPIVSADSAP
jgi:hypothetical protein